MGAMNRHIVILTEGTPWRCILRFAAPLFIGSLLQQLYYTVDTMMVGQFVGERALSSVGTCGVLINLLIAFSMGFSAGASIVSAQYFGAGEYAGIARNARASMFSLLVLSLVIGGVGVIWGRELLKYAVAVPDSLLDEATVYFRICVVGFLFQFLYNGIAALLRSIGDSMASLYFLLFSTVVNVVLDYVFLRWFGWGVAGAAYATVFSQLAACGVSFAYMYRRYEILQFWRRGIEVRKSDITAIVRNGFPMALQSMVGMVFNLLVQRLVNSFGEAMIASYTVVSRVEGYMHLPTTTLYQALPTYTAQNIGAGRRERIRSGLNHTVVMSMVGTFIISVIAFFWAQPIATSFGISGLSAEYCTAHTRWLSFPILMFALYFPYTGLYQGVGKGMVATVMSSTFLTICLMFAYTLQYIPEVGYRSLFVCKPLAWLFMVAINYVYYFKGGWQNSKAV
ncbi:MAG: MATE family efflux transporter [Bacteroides sp.]|nr:MATE family efflux transporter [Bacteroides sp.]